MSFLDNVRTKYETPGSSLGADFIRPALSECNLYRRETGWFRASALRVWAGSIINVLENDDVKIEIIAYPEVDQSLWRALRDTVNDHDKDIILQKHREKILYKALTVQSKADVHTKEIGKYIGELLSFLIASGKLEIKFVTLVDVTKWKIVEDDSEGELTHIKRGYFQFPCKTTVAFTGSANESLGGLMTQGEAFYVFDSRVEATRTEEIKNDVDITWSEQKVGYKTHPISKKLLNEIKKIAPINRPKAPPIIEDPIIDLPSSPNLDIPVDFWRHKKDAIKIFLEKKKGILEMATGTGKTTTALEVARQLLLKDKIEKIVIVPPDNKALCSQWVDEVYGWADKYIDKYQEIVIYEDFGEEKEKQKFVDSKSQSIIIASRRVDKLKFILENMNPERTLVIQDEVHNFGSSGMKELSGIQKNIKYTLGLSATPQRYFSEDETNFIYDELGPIIYSYPIENAIEDGILCPFNYHPLKVELTDEEKLKIKNLISFYNGQRNEKPLKMSQEEFRRKLANIKNEASDKKYVFESFVKSNPNLAKNSIIFCHTEEQARSLGEYMNAHVTDSFGIFVGRTRDNEQLKRLANKEIDCLISCKVLNEGIDVPSLENIFLLASPSTPLTTIQRIGRCIRIDSKNKNKMANVIDFICYRDIDNDDIIDADKKRQEWLSKVAKYRKN
ncbi:DEAD/DEAH box helicase family protein [Gammaproteobacteria bacterium]|nr:DEAD/DEAH box helicase family protein [Gammaproteobacteria bacterium]